MDFLKDNWIYVLGGLVVLYVLFSNRSGSTVNVTQGSDNSALAAIASNERENDENRRFGHAQNLLQYDLSLRSLNFQREQLQADNELQINLARINAENNAAANQNAMQLLALRQNYESYNNQLEANYRNAAIQAAYNTQPEVSG